MQRFALPVLMSALMVATTGGYALGDGDPDVGRNIFDRKCKSCHTAEEDGPHRRGPNLFGVVDRKAGTLDGFKYEEDYVVAGEKGLIWSEDAIVAYLNNPKVFLREASGNPNARPRMAFRIAFEQDARAIVAYLKSQK